MRLPATSLLVFVLAAGCADSRIASQRSMSAYRQQLAQTPASPRGDGPGADSAKVPQLDALREQAVRDEWVRRGYRVGNDRGDVLASAAARGWGGFSYLLWDLPTQLVAFSLGDRPARAVRMMEDRKSADVRRRGMNGLVRWDFAQRDPYTRRYRQIAEAETDAMARAVALRAANRSRDDHARSLFIKALSDSSPLVRLEAAKGLISLPAPEAVAPLIAAVNNPAEEKDVRIAAAEALKHYQQLDVARALAARLNERDFGVAWQSRRSLRRLTGRDHGYDESAWLEYLTGPDKPFG